MIMLLNASRIQKKNACAFTLVELMGVITVIAILAGLTLGGAGAVRRHAASSQAKSEIAALEAACERFNSENGSYPTNASSHNTTCVPSKNYDPRTQEYIKASAVLFSNLLGTTNLSQASSSKRYFEPKPSMTSGNYFVDPWGYSYGFYYDGTNPPLIWSTAGQTNAAGTNKWITSWPRL